MLKCGLIQNKLSRFEGAMNPPRSKPRRVWTVKEAKARLSEVLRLAEEEGPQQIGRRKPFVIVPAADWYAKKPPQKSMGQWLVESMPRGVNLYVAAKRRSRRQIPLAVTNDVLGGSLHREGDNCG